MEIAKYQAMAEENRCMLTDAKKLSNDLIEMLKEISLDIDRAQKHGPIREMVAEALEVDFSDIKIEEDADGIRISLGINTYADDEVYLFCTDHSAAREIVFSHIRDGLQELADNTHKFICDHVDIESAAKDLEETPIDDILNEADDMEFPYAELIKLESGACLLKERG